jgi:hypothetical protein
MKKGFIIKDSGRRQEFGTGAVRDEQTGKGWYHCISPFMEDRLAKWLEKGGEKYGERNWEKGMPFSRFINSAKRHLAQFMMGKEDEDHLAAVIFNAQAIIHFQELGRTDLDDMPHYLKH